MRILVALVCSISVLQSPMTAALPPLYQGIKEIDKILYELTHDPKLEQALGAGEVLESITKNSAGYEIETNRSRLQVDVEHLPPPQPGPSQIILHFHQAEAR